jgi:hypothetical protein
VREPGDVVWDLDKIGETMLQLPAYPRPPDATSLLDALRNTLVEWLRVNEHIRAYIIVADETVAEAIAARVQATVYVCRREGVPSGG